eukprot:EC690574.1.p3 GENE.EC690574.1~~EC690574.1.p3  ORF type:complete len:74 (-),score=22.85 EC690574.1:165-386(-)
MKDFPEEKERMRDVAVARLRGLKKVQEEDEEEVAEAPAQQEQETSPSGEAAVQDREDGDELPDRSDLVEDGSM